MQNYQWNGNSPRKCPVLRWGGRTRDARSTRKKWRNSIRCVSTFLCHPEITCQDEILLVFPSLEGKNRNSQYKWTPEVLTQIGEKFPARNFSHFNQSEGTAGLNYVNRKNPCIQRNNFISEFPCFQTYGSKENPNQTNEEKGDRLTRDRPTPPPGGVGVVRIKDPGCGDWLSFQWGGPWCLVTNIKGSASTRWAKKSDPLLRQFCKTVRE